MLVLCLLYLPLDSMYLFVNILPLLLVVLYLFEIILHLFVVTLFLLMEFLHFSEMYIACHIYFKCLFFCWNFTYPSAPGHLKLFYVSFGRFASYCNTFMAPFGHFLTSSVNCICQEFLHGLVVVLNSFEIILCFFVDMFRFLHVVSSKIFDFL